MRVISTALAHSAGEILEEQTYRTQPLLASEVFACIEKGVEGEGEGEGAKWGRGGGMGRSERREKEEANSGSRYMYLYVGMVKIY